MPAAKTLMMPVRVFSIRVMKRIAARHTGAHLGTMPDPCTRRKPMRLIFGGTCLPLAQREGEKISAMRSFFPGMR